MKMILLCVCICIILRKCRVEVRGYATYIMSFLPPLAGSGRGDPHYTSFENRRYDFYAQGEYIVFGVDISENRTFLVEARLAYPGWRASVTVALAFGVPGEYGYQVL